MYLAIRFCCFLIVTSCLQANLEGYQIEKCYICIEFYYYFILLPNWLLVISSLFEKNYMNYIQNESYLNTCHHVLVKEKWKIVRGQPSPKITFSSTSYLVMPYIALFIRSCSNSLNPCHYFHATVKVDTRNWSSNNSEQEINM